MANESVMRISCDPARTSYTRSRLKSNPQAGKEYAVAIIDAVFLLIISLLVIPGIYFLIVDTFSLFAPM
jgi:hypothetical protein